MGEGFGVVNNNLTSNYYVSLIDPHMIPGDSGGINIWGGWHGGLRLVGTETFEFRSSLGKMVDVGWAWGSNIVLSPGIHHY